MGCSNALNVRFSRFFMMVLATIYPLFGYIEFIYAMGVFSLYSAIVGTSYNVSTLLLCTLNYLGFKRVFKVNTKYKTAYEINRWAGFAEDIMRTIASVIIIVLYHMGYTEIAMFIAFLISIMMMISTFFGFCTASLVYILFLSLMRKLGFKE